MLDLSTSVPGLPNIPDSPAFLSVHDMQLSFSHNRVGRILCDSWLERGGESPQDMEIPPTTNSWARRVVSTAWQRSWRNPISIKRPSFCPSHSSNLAIHNSNRPFFKHRIQLHLFAYPSLLHIPAYLYTPLPSPL
jgi:hypothetical protein